MDYDLEKWQKKSKTTTVTQFLTSDECIQSKDFISLIDRFR